MANATGVVSIPASGGEAGLNRYLSEIKKFPILAPEEEYMLAKRWREHGDTDAAARLLTFINAFHDYAVVQWLDIRRHNFFQSPFCFYRELGCEATNWYTIIACVNKRQ